MLVRAACLPHRGNKDTIYPSSVADSTGTACGSDVFIHKNLRADSNSYHPFETKTLNRFQAESISMHITDDSLITMFRSRYQPADSSMSPQRGMAESMETLPYFRTPTRYPSMVGAPHPGAHHLRVQVLPSTPYYTCVAFPVV